MEALQLEFKGTERFRIIRRLGAGGMGVVYAAEDRERGHLVALKTIKHADYETLYRLKREFRALADLSHINLVALYDLVVEEGSCFFTMELVEGVDFLAFVRGQRVRSEDSVAHGKTLQTGPNETLPPSPSNEPFFVVAKEGPAPPVGRT